MQPLIDSVSPHPFLFWIACMCVAGILEVSLPSFTFIFVSIASLGAALVSLRWGWIVQTGAFTGVLALSVGIVRPFLLSHKKSLPVLHSRVNALMGKVGKVTDTIDAAKGTGRVLVEGQDWAARNKDKDVMEVGKEITVVSSDGIVLIVRKV